MRKSTFTFNIIKCSYLLVFIVGCSATNQQAGKFYTPGEDILTENQNVIVEKNSQDNSESSKYAISNSINDLPANVNVISSFSGKASWYGPGFHGKKTASGEVFDENKLTAAHRSLPLGTNVRITNLENGKSVIAKINDRGPFIGGRVIDGSKQIAIKLDYIDKGIANVKVDVLSNSVNKKVIDNTNVITNSTTTSSSIYVQLGAFSNPQNATNFKNSLVGQFKNIPVKNLKYNDLHKVLVGPFASQKLAEDVKIYLSQKGYTGFINTIGGS